jgi:hypothetical protein
LYRPATTTTCPSRSYAPASGSGADPAKVGWDVQLVSGVRNCPLMFELDETPTVEEFQEIYDDWFNVFLEKGLIENERTEIALNR